MAEASSKAQIPFGSWNQVTPRHDSTRSTCRAHAFLLCRACRTARIVVVYSRRKDKGLFPKNLPERCYGSDVWYPKCDVLVPHVLSQFRTIVRPPNPYLLLSLTLQGKEGREGARAPPRPSRLTRDDFEWPSHVLPTDRQTPPAGRVAPIPRWNARPIKSSKAIGERAARRTSAPTRAPDLWSEWVSE